MKNIISTDLAPKAVGAYSQGIEIDDFYFFSGQIAINPKTQKLEDETFLGQTEQIIKNIDALLKSQNLTKDNVIKTTIFLTDISQFAKVNEIYASYFNTNPPARSCVAVCALPMGAKVEIEIIAHK